MKRLITLMIFWLLIAGCSSSGNTAIEPKIICKTCTSTIARIDKKTGIATIIPITNTNDRFIKFLIDGKLFDSYKATQFTLTLCDETMIAKYMGTKVEVDEPNYPTFTIRSYYDCR